MTIIRKITAATTVLALAASGVAAAHTPIVGAQKTSSSRYSPVLIPGTGIKKGERLPAGAKVIYRDITIAAKQEVTTVLRAPAGTTLRALAERDMSHVGFQVNNRQTYYGRKHVSLRVIGERDMPAEVTERIYALVR